jgi:hypothetical protein
MRKSKETKQILLDWALEAEKAASNVANADLQKEWLRKAQVYRDLMAKLPTSIGGQTQGV